MRGCPTTDRREKRETSCKTFGIGEGRGRRTDCSGDSGNDSKDSGELHGGIEKDGGPSGDVGVGRRENKENKTAAVFYTYVGRLIASNRRQA